MSKNADSVTSEIRHLYEDTVRDSLARVFRLTFGTPCRQPDAGFRRIFNKRDTPRNLWWSKNLHQSQVEMDFLAHVAPLSTLPDINTNTDNPYVTVFKSTSQITSAIEVAHQFQQTKSESPEKTSTEAKADGDDDVDSDRENFQYVIAEITCGGADTVLKKLEQLEKDCYFLCSRACPSLAESDFHVLATVAFVAVVSPKLKADQLRSRIFNTSEPLPLLRELYNCGRFVWIEHTQTLGVVVKEIGNRLDSVGNRLDSVGNRLDSVMENLSVQMETKLSEQSQALEAKMSETLEAKLSEQNQTIKTLSEQIVLLQQFLLERLPEKKDASRTPFV